MKHADTQLIITRLMIEAGFRNKDGTYDRKGFCDVTGITPKTLANYLEGKTSISIKRVREIIDLLNLKSFDIV